MNDVDMKGDPILEEMAREFRSALVASGADPKNPPDRDDFPTERAFEEYQNRGGTVYSDPNQFVTSLIERVTQLD